jgi:hypothetical protein
MTERLLGFDRATGLAQWWLQDGEGNWAQRSSQLVDALLDLNREAQVHCNPYNAARDVRMVARIPLIVIAKWRNELGVDYWNPDHQGKVDALLNDADWRWLRTDFAGSAALQCRSWAVEASKDAPLEWRAPSKEGR